MNTNPYAPPSPDETTAAVRYRLLYIGMFWLSAALAVLVAGFAVVTFYFNYVAVTQMGGSLPSYILLVTLLMLGCSAGLVYSSLQWRRHRSRRALLSLAAVMVSFFAGPWLLLRLLY